MIITAISDTHSLHNRIDSKDIPGGNLLIHSGDFTGRSTLHEGRDFAKWLGQFELDYDKILLVAGNHDTGLVSGIGRSYCVETFNEFGIDYIHDAYFEYKDKLIFGSPVQPEFFNWAFNFTEEYRKSFWDNIDLDGVDVLITHCPPLGILDECRNGHVGCNILADKVSKSKVKAHFFGHIHEGYGIKEIDGTKFVNASICTGSYNPTNKPITVEIE